MALQDYITALEQMADKANKTQDLVNELRENIKETYLPSDDLLRIQSSNDRTSSLYSKQANSDSVIKKLSKIIRNEYEPGDNYGKFSTPLCCKAIKLYLKIQERKMKQQEYEYLEKTPLNDLLEEWYNEIIR
jgi:two-component SAPR family response regulator